jgi:hypothetical protein
VPYHMNVDMSNCESLLAACEDLYSARTVHGSLRWSSLDRPSAFSVGWPVYFRITVKSITVLQVFRKGNFPGFWNAGMLECWNAGMLESLNAGTLNLNFLSLVFYDSCEYTTNMHPHLRPDYISVSNYCTWLAAIFTSIFILTSYSEYAEDRLLREHRHGLLQLPQDGSGKIDAMLEGRLSSRSR